MKRKLVQDRYTSLKKALIDKGYLFGKTKGTLGVPLASPRLVSGLPDPNRIHPALQEFSEECVKLDRNPKIPPVEKYILLLYKGIKKYVDVLSSDNKSERDIQLMKEFKSFLDKQVPLEDILYCLQYAMGEGIFSRKELSKLLGEVVAGKNMEEASEESTKMACEMFLLYHNNPTPQSTKKQKVCINIILASTQNLTDLNQIMAFSNDNEKGVSSQYNNIYYYARGRTDKKYNDFKNTLMKLVEPNENLSSDMKVTFKAIATLANSLYQDKKTPEDTKDNCHKLLSELDDFSIKISQIRADQRKNGETEENKQALKKEIKNVEKMAESLNDKINQLSADTSDKRWGRILGLAIGTLGIGLFWIVPSLRSDSDFFKTPHKHHSIVSEARKIIKQAEPLNLTQKIRPLPPNKVPEDKILETRKRRRGQ